MKQILVFCFALCSTLLIAQTEIDDIGTFTELSIGGNVEATLIPSNESAVKIIRDHEDLKIEREGNVLKVKLNKVKRIFKSDDRAAKVEIHYTSLDEINASAGAEIDHEGTMKFSTIELRFGSGAIGDFEVDGKQMLARAGEGADLKIKGTVDELEARASTGGHVKARQLKSKKVEAEASTGGMASVYASESIIADAHTGGMISYDGSPEKYDVKESLGGSVRGN